MQTTKVILVFMNVGLITAIKDRYSDVVPSFRQEVDGSLGKDLLHRRLSDLDEAHNQWLAVAVKEPDIKAVSQIVHYQYLLLVDITKCGLNLNSEFVKWLKEDMDGKIQNMNYSVKKSSEATAQQKTDCEGRTTKLHYDFLNYGRAIGHEQFTKDIMAAKTTFGNLNTVKYIEEPE